MAVENFTTRLKVEHMGVSPIEANQRTLPKAQTQPRTPMKSKGSMKMPEQKLPTPKAKVKQLHPKPTNPSSTALEKAREKDLKQRNIIQ